MRATDSFILPQKMTYTLVHFFTRLGGIIRLQFSDILPSCKYHIIETEIYIGDKFILVTQLGFSPFWYITINFSFDNVNLSATH